MRFGVSVIQEKVLSAKLRVYAYTKTSDGPTVIANSNDRSETEINWNNRPAPTSDAIDYAGATPAYSWVTYDVTPVVSGDGTYSFLFVTTTSNGVKLASPEGNFSPELVVTSTLEPGASADPVLVGAGDIASCSNDSDEATTKLLDGIPGTVFTAGDNAYDSGTYAEFKNCYDPTWGRHKARTKPTPGNHEYVSPSGKDQRGAGYFDYFNGIGDLTGAAGDRGFGYYSYNLDSWHIIALNSEICGPDDSTICDRADTQMRWLEQDLATSDTSCTLAYWHHPVFSSGSEHGNDARMKTAFRILYDNGAEVVVSGHDHDYERFAPQRPDGTLDSSQGIRQFVVGTGGRSLRPFGTIQPNSQVRNADTFGVIKFTLHADSYDWEFVPEAGKSFTDSGSGQCHA